MTANVWPTAARLTIVPITLRLAQVYIAEYHRHNRPPRGHKFSLGVVTDDCELHGVAVVGRPIARALDDGLTAEVVRTCTDGTANANSALYGACWRTARAMGYRRLVTYTQAAETGASLRADGAAHVADLPPRKGWADSSVLLAHLRHPVGDGGVARKRWEWSA